ncbi:MAG: peptidase domain-containing ABC transporter [Myxococcota bacterium]
MNGPSSIVGLGRRVLPMFRQSEVTECGLACLAMIGTFHGHRLDLNSLRQRFALSLKGASLVDLMQMADQLVLGSRAIRVEMESLDEVALPAILHWDLDHFVVLARVRRDGIVIHDPAEGVRHLSFDEASNHFTGVALELTPTTDFAPLALAKRTRLWDLWSEITGLRSALAQILVLSLLVQAFALISPLFLQLVVDEALVQFDASFLLVLGLAFGAFTLINATTELVRGWIVLVVGQNLTYQMAGNVLRHLLRLPHAFIEKRHVGDVMSRMGSIEPLQRALTEGLVTALLDGAMALTTAIVMSMYSAQLAAVVFVTTGLYLGFVFGIYPLVRRRESDEIVARAHEQTHLIESIRASRAIKLFGREVEREGAWRNRFSEVVSGSIAVGQWRIGIQFVRSALFGLQLVAVVYLAALQVLDQTFTVGMLFAFLSYRQHFAERAGALAAQGLELRMLGLHLERLSDIVQAEPEPGLLGGGGIPRAIEGRITLRDVGFRYASNEPFVLGNLDLDVAAGAYIAIIGRSGGGKTTLLKVITGLVDPSVGKVEIDGQDLRSLGTRAWRSQIAVVMQDDELLSGTIADNIAFFAPRIDMERVRTAAIEAGVDDEIMAMPGNYLSHIGDMGAALSGGQVQRILIARALYQRPRVLFLDEGTANLDVNAERRVADLVAALPVTRIVFAHRPELVARADRVLELRGGRLHELDSPAEAVKRHLT